MPQDFNRRKRKRTATLTPRFADSSIAFEISLIRLSLEALQELEKSSKKQR